MANMSVELKIPAVGESITEVDLGEWKKKDGDLVGKDEIIAIIETEKATVELPAPVAGRLKISRAQGTTAKVGDVIGSIEPSADGSAPQSAPAVQKSAAAVEAKTPAPAPTATAMPAAERVMAQQGIKAADVTGTGLGGRILKEDVQRAGAPAAAPPGGTRQEDVVRMSRLRRTVAERLVRAQHNAALLTTFNEVDMSSTMSLRKEFGDAFLKKHGVKLGFMSFFVRAVVGGLREVPQLNAEIRGDDVVYKNYQDIGVAIGGGKGLVVPVLRNAERLNFAEIEKAIGDFAAKAKDGKLSLEELEGGTFTISNGGVYGSLLSTPIVNPPQSGVLGMHTIQERPVALNGQVVIRPMMYIALTYDHRIVDGREAVTFLKRVKSTLESPGQVLLDL